MHIVESSTQSVLLPFYYQIDKNLVSDTAIMLLGSGYFLRK